MQASGSGQRTPPPLPSWPYGCTLQPPRARAPVGSGAAGYLLMVTIDPQACTTGLAALMAAGQALGPCSAKNRRLCVS